LIHKKMTSQLKKKRLFPHRRIGQRPWGGPPLIPVQTLRSTGIWLECRVARRSSRNQRALKKKTTETEKLRRRKKFLWGFPATRSDTYHGKIKP